MSEFSELLHRAKEGDSAAKVEMLHRFERRLDGAIRRKMGVKGGPLRRQFDTSDLRQSVFREVLRGLPRIGNLSEDEFLKRLYVIAKRRVARAHRRVLGPDLAKKQDQFGTTTGLELKAPGPGPSTKAAASDEKNAEAARLAAALAALTPRQQEIVKLHSEGLKFKDIAKRVGLRSEDAARMQHTRAWTELVGRCGPKSG